MSETRISYMKTMTDATAVYLDRHRVGTIMQDEEGWIYVPAGRTLRNAESEHFDSLEAVKASLEEL